ncbi:unnamed protein product [Dibothriocephalus latus]|uniref:Uncharacterized protein n=1 Tax=Dibothriocephalus latus TaxID=60516 RepID=A0A3P7LZD1_DIBLA|nr:unnamed protein product [Dibothriocephalus latus]
MLCSRSAAHAGRGDYMSCIKSSYRYYATDGAIFVTSSRASSRAFPTSAPMEYGIPNADAVPFANNETDYIDELPLPPEAPVEPVTSGTFNCSETCIRDWSATPIPETNTKLVVVDPVCPCAPNDVDWHLSPSLAIDVFIFQLKILLYVKICRIQDIGDLLRRARLPSFFVDLDFVFQFIRFL